MTINFIKAARVNFCVLMQHVLYSSDAFGTSSLFYHDDLGPIDAGRPDQQRT